MKLQISFDLTDLDKALEIAKQVEKYADILEVGTLLIYKYGQQAIEQFKQAFENKIIFADAKIVDRGNQVVSIIAEAGADWTSVMAGTTNEMIHLVCTSAHNLNKKVMIDLLDTPSFGQSALEAQSLGGDALLFHTTYEEDSVMLLDKWGLVRGNTNLPIFISGKITRENIDEYINIKPDGIVISKAITQAEQSEQEAAFFREKIDQAS